MTSCGSTSERHAAMIHGAVVVLYAAMLAFHVASVVQHWRRA